MVSCCPLTGATFPFQKAFSWLLNGWILTIYKSWDDPPNIHACYFMAGQATPKRKPTHQGFQKAFFRETKGE